MSRVLTFRLVLAVATCVFWSLNPRGQTANAASGRAGHGQSAEHRDDPCDQLPDPRGNALGIDKKCPQGGISSGVAKGDFNGDGIADLAIGEPGATINGHANAGDVIVVYGSGSGLSTTAVRPELWYADRWSPRTDSRAGDLFGTALASGDFNADGFSDLAIGIPGKDFEPLAARCGFGCVYDNLGQVVLLYGSANGLFIKGGQQVGFTLDDHFYLRDGHVAPGAKLGQSLAWGDFNGDGVGDLAIGAPNYKLDAGLFAANQEAGAVWILMGTKKTSTSFGGLTTQSNLLFQQDDLESCCYPTDSHSLDGDHFGAALASGDFDGDGHSDLAIGAPDKFFDLKVGLFSYDPGVGGEVFLVPGTDLGLNLPDFRHRTGENYNPLGRYGAALATGDFNGDGFADLAVGIPLWGSQVVNDRITTEGSGAVEVSLGVSCPDPSPINPACDTTFIGTTSETLWRQQDMGGTDVSDDHFGAALAAGDFNGDKFADLAIGAPKKNAGGFTNSGEVRVIYGSATGLSTTVRNVQVFRDSSGSQTEARFGSSLTAWNFGRNECPGGASFCLLTQIQRTADLAIGSPYRDVNGLSDAGSVNVVYGSVVSNGLTGTNRQVHTADSIGFGSLAGAHFGASMY